LLIGCKSELIILTGVFGETWMAFWSGEVGRRVTVKKLVDLDFSSAALEALRNETKKLM